MEKKVSIILPVYNVEKYLAKSIDSIVNQTYDNIELIIVNDGSPDNSERIIDQYKKKYKSKIKAFKTENHGLGAARNFGISKSTGDYILFVDADDYIEHNMVELLMQSIISEKSDVAVCGYNTIDESNYNVIAIHPSHIKEGFNKEIHNIMFGQTSVWNKIYKKDLLVDNNITFRSRLWYEDVDFSLKVFLNAKKISYIDNNLYNYLIRPGSIMNNNNANRVTEIIDAFEEAINYYKKANKFKKYYDELEFAALYHIYICGTVRVLSTKNKMKDKKKVIDILCTYFFDNFENYRNNKYIPFLNTKQKILYKLISFKWFYGVTLLIKLRRLL